MPRKYPVTRSGTYSPSKVAMANVAFNAGRNIAPDVAKAAYKYGKKAYKEYTKRAKQGTKSNTKLTKDISNMRRKIKKMAEYDDATTGTMTYRSNSTLRMGGVINTQGVYFTTANTPAQIETVLAQCKYFNPSVPGTLIVGNPSGGTYQRNILVESVTLKLRYRNNYIVPCRLVVYKSDVRDDTSHSPVSAWTSGLVDGTNLTAITDLNQYPTDYNLVNDLWKLKKICDVVMQPGQERVLTYNSKAYEYDPSVYDSHNFAYQKSNRAGGLLSIVRGCVAREIALPDNIGRAGCGLSVEISNIYKIKYSAGINITYTHVLNTYNAMATGALVTNKPISGNQTYA